MATVTATTSGDWDVGSNWSGSSVPQSTDTVIIPAGFTMTISSDDTVTVGSGGSISLSGNIISNGTITISSGGTITLVTNFAFLDTENQLTVSGTLINNGIIVNRGTVSIPSGGILTNNSTGTINNNTQFTTNSSAGTFNNYGSYQGKAVVP